MITPTSTSTVVIEELRDKFSQFGIPETIVTDNGTCFTSAEFELFLEKIGVKHLTTAPYHPASNGLPERAVQIIKKGIKKCKDVTLQTRLSRMLLAYRLTPQCTTAQISTRSVATKPSRASGKVTRRSGRATTIVVLRRGSFQWEHQCGLEIP